MMNGTISYTAQDAYPSEQGVIYFRHMTINITVTTSFYILNRSLGTHFEILIW